MSTTDATNADSTNVWRPLIDDLTTRLSTFGTGSSLGIMVRKHDLEHPLLEFTHTSSRRLRCTVADADLPSRHPESTRRMRSRLLQLGWNHLPRKQVHILEVGRTQPHALVGLVIRTLQDIWDITDPRDLTIREPDLVLPPPNIDSDHITRSEMSVVPCCPDHLLQLARTVLSAETGRELTIDNASVVLPHTEDAPSHVFASDPGPFLVFATTLTHRLIEPATLGAAMVGHSRQWPDMSVIVGDDHVYVQRVVDCAIFHPRNLSVAFARWRNFLNTTAWSLIVELNPGPPGAHSCMHNAIPIGLQTLLDLHAERPLTPQRIAHLTNNKADRIRDYLRVCSEQADGWRTTAAQVRRFGNDSEMGLHAGMFDYFNEFAVLLRRALLLVDDQPESRSK